MTSDHQMTEGEGLTFQPWPKIARLHRIVVISEKIDGTNSAVIITDDNIYAQSRSRLITPAEDNHGFARWAQDNRESLYADLGPGRHFGEFWGSGINRGYGLQKGEKRFSLFNTKKWAPLQYEFTTPKLSVVPVLYEGRFSFGEIEYALGQLEEDGSVASDGFMRPEGVVVYHTAANMMFKITLEGDEQPKGVSAA